MERREKNRKKIRMDGDIRGFFELKFSRTLKIEDATSDFAKTIRLRLKHACG